MRNAPGGRRKPFWMVWAVCCLLALLMALMVRYILRRTARITLPDADGAAGISVTDPVGNPFTPLDVTPRTVQDVIATLSRPLSCCRTLTVTQFWTGGSGSYTPSVTVSAPWTRVDMEQADGHIRHTLTDEVTTYLWYDDDTAFYQVPAGNITADNEQHIPTYEDVLELPQENIVLADYRFFSGMGCIYVEAEEIGGYVHCYWINVESGLLAAAETFLDRELIYRMEASEVDRIPDSADFTLPDGTVLPVVRQTGIPSR